LVLATIWAKIRNIGISARLAWAYTIVFSVLFALAFSAIYIIFEQYRQHEFFQRLKDKTLTTYKLMIEVDEIDVKTLTLLDKNTINSLSEQKIQLFDSTFNLIYSSIGEASSTFPQKLLKDLKGGAEEVEYQDNKHELIGIRFSHKGNTYFGIARAFDRYGKSKLAFLKASLFVVYVVVVALLILLSRFLSKSITKPLIKLTSEIGEFSPEDLSVRIEEPKSNDEVALLTSKFNELIEKLEKAFKFQYHFIHHVSHELKTPLAVLISNAETALSGNDNELSRSSLIFIKSGLMEVSHIINAMLDISKVEHQIADSALRPTRIDELLFECIDEIVYLNNNAQFDIDMDEAIVDSELLTVKGNIRMLKMALMNLLKNAIYYSTDNKASVTLKPGKNAIEILIANDGDPIMESEQDKLFSHLFRGQNSKNKKGFGIGLVLVKRIILLHGGTVFYQFTNRYNTFSISIPIHQS
jgi:signal transduction histidine kinase/cell division protein FtsL